MRTLILAPAGIAVFWGSAGLAFNAGVPSLACAFIAVIAFAWFVWAVGTA